MGGPRLRIEAYGRHGGASVRPRDVRLYEVLIALGWYRDALAGEHGSQFADQELVRLKGILRRAQASD
jgi:hypothetical protein